MATKMITVRGKAFSSYKAVPLVKATRHDWKSCYVIASRQSGSVHRAWQGLTSHVLGTFQLLQHCNSQEILVT